MPARFLKEVKKRVERFPRKHFLHLPTPFQRLDSLSESLQGPRLFMKRDDLTGQGFGGNKSRKLEFIIQDALDKKCDTLITWASLQSNWCLQCAITARRFGLNPLLVLFKTYDLADEPDGNILLDHLVGAEVRIQEAERGKVITLDKVQALLAEIGREVRRAGHTPYTVAVGGSQPAWSMDKPLGAISYVNAFLELWEQAHAAGVPVDAIVLATGSGATQAGLAVAAKACHPGIRVIGISVSDEKESFAKIVLDIASATEKALGVKVGLGRSDIIVLDDYLGEGYGVLTSDVTQALQRTFQEEGVVLDPVYTGKAMAALMDLARKEYFRPKSNVVFWHTGGTPALFPYRRTLLDQLRSSAPAVPK